MKPIRRKGTKQTAVSKNVKKALQAKGQVGAKLFNEKKFEKTRKKAFGLYGNKTK